MKLPRKFSTFLKRNRGSNTQVSFNKVSKEIIKEYNKTRIVGHRKVACYAPFKSIYFGHNGKISVCCYNRQFVLGIYPKNTLEEIWFSENAETLRQALTQYDFSNGCKGCFAHLVGRNFDASKSKQYDPHKLNSNGYPSIMEFELENLCNLECIMCNGDFSSLIRANREKREPLISPYNDEFIKQLRVFIPHLEDVKFYGGEPFLIETYYKIWELIMEVNPNVRISVQTNATILNNRVKNILNKTNFHINISLDSLNKQTYESIRVNAKFERVIENVEWFINYCHSKETFIGISTCAMRNNWKELPEILKYCNDRNVQVYFHTVFYPLELAIRTINPDELKEISEYFKSFSQNLLSGNSIQEKNKNHFIDLINQINNWIVINENVADINSFEDFKNYLSNKLLKPYFQQKFSSDKREKLLQILDTIDKQMEGKFISNDIFSRIDLSNDFAIEDFLVSLETKSIEELKEKAKRFYS